METVREFLHASPIFCLFLTILVGHLIGRVHVKGVGFGAVVGTLIAGMAVGILAAPELPDVLRWVFFYLFLFAIGYSVGPQFFGSLKKAALPQILLAVIVAVTGLVTVVTVAALFRFDEGIAVGLLSGGMTQSAALGTGLSAIAELPIDEAAKAALSANAPLADAITYGFGDLGLIVFLTSLGPMLLRADLRKEARALEASLAAASPGGQIASWASYGVRAYRVDNAALAGLTVSGLEQRFAAARLSVHRVERNDDPITPAPDLALQTGDRIVVSAQRRAFTDTEQQIGAELDDARLLSVPTFTASVVITNRAVHGRTLGELGADPVTRGVYLSSLQRGTVQLPREAWTIVERGDILRVVGAPDDVERVARHAGFIERDLSRTDLGFIGAAVCLGMLLGLVKLNVSGIAIGLGTAGSILMVGLVGGWARSRYPVFGSVPEPAQRLLMDIGLIVFIAMVGMHAGPHAVEAYHQSGGAFFGRIFGAGMIVTVVPLAVGALAAKFLFRMSPLMTLGGLAGAQTCTPGLNALREATGSNIGTIAYTVPYAIGNILLTIWGPVIVAIVHAMR